VRASLGLRRRYDRCAESGQWGVFCRSVVVVCFVFGRLVRNADYGTFLVPFGRPTILRLLVRSRTTVNVETDRPKAFLTLTLNSASTDFCENDEDDDDGKNKRQTTTTNAAALQHPSQAWAKATRYRTVITTNTTLTNICVHVSQHVPSW
jgi:hypothetical protein